MTFSWADRHFAVDSAESSDSGPLRADHAVLRDWSALEAQAELPTQTREFAEAVARCWLDEGKVQVVTASRGSSVALVPLCRDRSPLARWRMIGAREIYEPGDALIGDAHGAGALADVLVRLDRPLSIDRIPAGSALLDALSRAMKRRGLVLRRPATPTPTLALDQTWETPELRLNARRRSDCRRAARKAEEFGPVSYEVISPGPAEFDACFDEAMAVEEKSWKRETGTALASDPKKQAFFRDYFRVAASHGDLRIAFMRIGGEAVAMQMALVWHRRFWLFKIGFDESYARCSPGNLLMLHSLGWAARSGLGSYEFLGTMEPWIAELWTRESRPCVRLRTYPFGPRGLIALAADTASWIAARARLHA